MNLKRRTKGGWNDAFFREIASELCLFRGYIDKLEETVSKEILEFEEKIKKNEVIIAEGDDFVWTASIINGISDTDYNLDEVFNKTFPNLQRKALVLSFYSFFEDALIQLCNVYKDHINLDLLLSDVSGKGIDKYRRYLTKVAKVDFTEIDSKCWVEITNIKNLRNNIAHNNGRIPYAESSNNKKLRSYIDSNKYLCRESAYIYLNSDNIFIQKGYLLTMVLTFEHFFALIDNEIKKNT